MSTKWPALTTAGTSATDAIRQAASGGRSCTSSRLSTHRLTAYNAYSGQWAEWESVNETHRNDWLEVADAVIRELGQRRCERCRHYTPVDQFPLPYEGSDRMRPFCNTCTDYIEWATS